MGELVATLRRFGELDVSDQLAEAQVVMSPATMDRRLAPDRAAMTLRGRSHTKPGSLLKDAIAIRAWAQWDDAAPGFVEIDLVGHEGGNSRGEFCFTFTVTDIATGWTENRTVRNKAEVHVFAALTDVVEHLPFPIRGIDSDNADIGIAPTSGRSSTTTASGPNAASATTSANSRHSATPSLSPPQPEYQPPQQSIFRSVTRR